MTRLIAQKPVWAYDEETREWSIRTKLGTWVIRPFENAFRLFQSREESDDLTLEATGPLDELQDLAHTRLDERLVLLVDPAVIQALGQARSASAALAAEVERLRPHYQSGTIKDHARRQMLDHFEKFAATLEPSPGAATPSDGDG